MRMGIDVDDCLFKFFETFFSYYQAAHNVHIPVESITNPHFADALGIDRAQLYAHIDAFVRSPYHRLITPKPGALITLPRLVRAGHELDVVTSRPPNHEGPLMELLNNYFPETFRRIHMNAHWVGDSTEMTKLQICRANGIDFLIDDHPHNFVPCHEAGLQVGVFDMPWNQSHSSLPIPRFTHWAEVERYVESYKNGQRKR